MVRMALLPSHLSRRALFRHLASGNHSSLGWMRRAFSSLAILGGGSLTRGADVLRPGLGEDVLGPRDFR